jgi:hypothetical protein
MLFPPKESDRFHVDAEIWIGVLAGVTELLHEGALRVIKITIHRVEDRADVAAILLEGPPRVDLEVIDVLRDLEQVLFPIEKPGYDCRPEFDLEDLLIRFQDTQCGPEVGYYLVCRLKEGLRFRRFLEEFRIGERGFDIHTDEIQQAFVNQVLDDLRLGAVGLEAYLQAKLLREHTEFDQGVLLERGFAAGEEDPVYEVSVLPNFALDIIDILAMLFSRRDDLRILAIGTLEVTSRKEDHCAYILRPIHC